MQYVRDLAGRQALVLGANHPIAAAIALAFAKAGADVAVTSTDGDPEQAFALRPLRRQIEAEGRRAIADIADLGNGSSVQIAVRQIAKQLGRIDIVVIAAGEDLEKPSDRVTDSEWSRAIAYNLGAYFYAARAAAREFADNEPVDGIKGRIIAVLPADVPGQPVPRAARAGVEALMHGLAEEWRDKGIFVTTLAQAPGTAEAAIVQEALKLS